MPPFQPDFNRLKKVLLRQGEPDLVPFYELFADPEVIAAFTRKQVTAGSTVEFHYRLGYDYVPAGTGLGYARHDLHVQDTAGLSRGERSFVNNTRGTIENRKDFDAYPWPELTPAAFSPVLETAPLLPKGMKIIVGMSGILENVMWLMGYMPLSYALYEDEPFISDFFERIGSNQVKMVRLCLEMCHRAAGDASAIGAVVMGDDMGHYTGTMLSPEMMRKYVFPWQKKLVEVVHSFDLPMILHSCGNLEAVMDDLIDYVGIDAKHSFEDKILPMPQVKQKYGSRIAVLGGIDVGFLTMSTEDQVRPYVDRVLEACMPGGGYALGTGNSVANYIPLRNYLAMLDEGRIKGIYQ